jgi:hypothetical protein
MAIEAHFRKCKHYFSPSSNYNAEEDAESHCHKICISIRHVLKSVKENTFTLYFIMIIGVSKSIILRHQAMKKYGRIHIKLNALLILALHENFPLSHLWKEPAWQLRLVREKNNIPCCQGITLGVPSFRQSLSYPYTVQYTGNQKGEFVTVR